jgi:hypothetical protein
MLGRPPLTSASYIAANIESITASVSLTHRRIDRS